MADSEDRTQREGVSADGHPRRQPPIIDVEAVEVSLGGSRTTTAGWGPTANPSTARPKRILRFLSPARLAIIGSACFIAAIAGGALWIYFAADASDAPPPHATSPAVPDDVVARIAKLEAISRVPPSQPSPPPPALAGEVRDLGSRVATHDAQVAALTDRIASLEGAVRDAAAAARVVGERADEVAGRSDRERPNSDEQNRAQLDDRSALDDLANRIATLESQQEALRQKQEGLARATDAITAVDKAVRLATVAAALRSTVERNSPFTAELMAARSLGVDEKALASLAPFAATGLPTPGELYHDLSTLLPELRRLSLPPGKDLGYLGRLQASAVKMLHIRPVQNQPGDDPATIMGRIEFEMAQQDMEAMVVELAKLPAPARELARPWGTKVLARQNALAAAQRIATASLAQLGEPHVRGLPPR
jgi:hypothetical protein